MPCKLRFFTDFCLALTASQTLIRGSLEFTLESMPVSASIGQRFDFSLANDQAVVPNAQLTLLPATEIKINTAPRARG